MFSKIFFRGWIQWKIIFFKKRNKGNKLHTVYVCIKKLFHHYYFLKRKLRSHDCKKKKKIPCNFLGNLDVQSKLGQFASESQFKGSSNMSGSINTNSKIFLAKGTDDTHVDFQFEVDNRDDFSLQHFGNFDGSNFFHFQFAVSFQSHDGRKWSLDENGESSIARSKTFNFQRFDSFGNLKFFLSCKNRGKVRIRLLEKISLFKVIFIIEVNHS